MRLHLTLALITALALFITLRSARRHVFTYQEVQALAEKRASAPYVAPPDVLPPQMQKLTPLQEAGIFWRDTYRLWRKKGYPFQVDFYHQLKSNPQPHFAPQINTVDRKGSHLLAYSPAFFNYLDLSKKPPAPLDFIPPLPRALGYAGFYVRYPNMGIHSGPSSLDGFFSVLGASYFRVLAREQVYGLSARGLALNTSLNQSKKTEEFPAFVEWWLQEPASDRTQLVLDALLDSPSVCGAYEFKIRPGAVTSVDVHATLYFRQPVDRLGLAPFSSMYLYGENAKDHLGDNVHPEIHDSDGVLMQRSNGEWVWRPLEQETFLQVYAFGDTNPKGFGLVQRDRDFAHYQDLDKKYNVRPSAWVSPRGDWGKGEVELTQLNSADFNTDNVVLSWHPADAVKGGDRRDFSYTIDFYMNDAQRPPLAYCKQTLVNVPAPPPPNAPPPVNPGPSAKPEDAAKPAAPIAGKLTVAAKVPAAPGSPDFVGPPAPGQPRPKPIPTGTTPVQFLIDFAGANIENTPANQPPDFDLNFDPPGTYLREKHVEKNTYDNSWRVTFTIIPFKHFQPTELRCRLLHANKPITETWTYTWHQ